MSGAAIRGLAALAVVAAVALVVVRMAGDDDSGPAESAVAATDTTETFTETPAIDPDPTENDATEAETPEPASELPDLGAMPALSDISGWLNTDGASFDDVRNEVTIVQFWTFGCSNCKATLPHLQELYASRHDDGLEIIGVHAHEFEYERDPANVATAVVDLGVTWPVALDTNKTNFGEWQGSRRYWPRTYVIDSNNRIRFDHIGEGQYDELAATVDTLLAQSA